MDKFASFRSMFPRDLMKPHWAAQKKDHNPEKPKKFDPSKMCSARFVKENLADKSEILAGSHFSKTWTLRNDGNVSWPAGTTLRQTSGDDFGLDPHFVITHPVRPSDDVEVTLDLWAPSQEGRYTAFFRL